ncbi:CaiB/BaiF CoA transferase family protein [Sinorhizobium psoraleae]|uniref:CoA transferase n=1 Tax=Sinorhizobium psoraleae TaxID=520838 RepID=A0ABT4KNE9_9HYPH|nr:CoA transferase [Sinorhizobium psoraleae]MCZ4093373.1 CoA transferase [Sinorhizobium psoraleae]
MKRAALTGVKVLDLSRLVAGNMATLQLADFGADVIKVEQPKVGDPLRQWRKGNLDLWWREYGRNKRSLALNIKTQRGQELLLSLVGRADILVENFVPGKLEDLGLPHSRFLIENSRLVILSISAWGQDGPYRNRPGFGTLVEAMSGFASMLGFADRPPTLPPIPMADMITGIYGAFAALAALRHRDETGEGQVIDLSLLEAIYSVLGPVAAEYESTGRYPKRNGNRSPNSSPRNTYPTLDRKWIALSASTPKTAEKLFQLTGLGYLLGDERFATNEARVRNGDETDRIVADALGKFTLDELMRRFEQAGVAGAPVYEISDFVTDPHVKARGILAEFDDPELGTYRMHAPLPRMSATPGRIRTQGPRLGEHSAAILEESLGLTRQEILSLAKEGVIDQ